MSNKKKREKTAAKLSELERRQRLIAELESRKYDYSKDFIVSDTDNELWGEFIRPNHNVHIHLAACYCGITVDKGEGKVFMTVRANPYSSCALSKHMYSEDLEEVINKFYEYKNFVENIPETTNWSWYIEHGFKYYQV
jgi:hypothetical protein